MPFHKLVAQESERSRSASDRAFDNFLVSFWNGDLESASEILAVLLQDKSLIQTSIFYDRLRPGLTALVLDRARTGDWEPFDRLEKLAESPAFSRAGPDEWDTDHLRCVLYAWMENSVEGQLNICSSKDNILRRRIETFPRFKALPDFPDLVKDLAPPLREEPILVKYGAMVYMYIWAQVILNSMGSEKQLTPAYAFFESIQRMAQVGIRASLVERAQEKLSFKMAQADYEGKSRIVMGMNRPQLEGPDLKSRFTDFCEKTLASWGNQALIPTLIHHALIPHGRIEGVHSPDDLGPVIMDMLDTDRLRQDLEREEDALIELFCSTK